MKLSDLTEMKTIYLKTVRVSGEAMLKEGFIEFFAANPQVKAIKWRQYTPYFNDGDSCVFGVHDFEIAFFGIENDDDEFINMWNLTISNELIHPQLIGIPVNKRQAIGESVRNFRKQFHEHEDMFEIIFGDHATITATRQGFTVEEFEHD